jgi:hypothetical protein
VRMEVRPRSERPSDAQGEKHIEGTERHGSGREALERRPL